MTDQATTVVPAPRTVLFLTASGASDIPSGVGALACLLPFGCATFAERVLGSCARAGLQEIDLVVSDHPEQLRKVIGDGGRWGLKLNWHLAKETTTPYGVLRTIGLEPGQRVLIGHGHQWVSDRVISALALADHVAVRIEKEVAWTGWVSMDALFVHAISPHADHAALSEVAVSLHSRQCLMVGRREFAQGTGAQGLLQAQELVLRSNVHGDAIPASWVRYPWGARSPDAFVHPKADMRGPILVGPGCRVGRKAQIGPGTVLSRDVVVVDGAVVRDTLVLPNTYVGGNVTLDKTVVQGNVVQHVKWAVKTSLRLQDGMLMPLQETRIPTPGWSGRVLAGLLAGVLSPAALCLSVAQRLRGQAPGWQRIVAVVGRSPASDALRCREVRAPREGAGNAGWLLGRFGALLDVMEGKRQWFGVRPRVASQWYSLGRDWQTLFGHSPLGFFHAPAWVDQTREPDSEALAVADAYFAVQQNLGERLRILLALARTWRPTGPAFKHI